MPSHFYPIMAASPRVFTVQEEASAGDPHRMARSHAHGLKRLRHWRAWVPKVPHIFLVSISIWPNHASMSGRDPAKVINGGHGQSSRVYLPLARLASGEDSKEACFGLQWGGGVVHCGQCWYPAQRSWWPPAATIPIHVEQLIFNVDGSRGIP